MPESPQNPPRDKLELSSLQRSLARHALGFDGRNKTSYRNHYVVGSGPDYDAWLELVSRGLAKTAPGSDLSGGDPVFWCTRELALAVREPDEHLERGFE
jgi:hypothetical protein